MRRLKKFFQLPTEDRRLLISAAALLWIVQLGLWILLFESLYRFLSVKRRFASNSKKSAPVSRIVWAVAVMSRYVPCAACLTQALVTQSLLDRFGQPASLGIGVAKDLEGRFRAHAWVEVEGDIVIGKL